MLVDRIITQSLKDEYLSNGVVVARDILPDQLINEAGRLAKELFEKADHKKFEKSTFWKKQNDRYFLEKYEPIIDRSEVFQSLYRHESVISIVGALLNDKSPHLMKDKLIYKSPGQDGYPLHQDYNWWHAYPPNELCTAVIPLEASGQDNGGIEFFLGCHDEVFLPEGENRPFNHVEKSKLIDKDSIIYDLQPGDLLVFHSLTPHFSGRNMSSYSRTQFYPTYCSSRVGDVYQQQLDNHRTKSIAINATNIYEG